MVNDGPYTSLDKLRSIKDCQRRTFNSCGPSLVELRIYHELSKAIAFREVLVELMSFFSTRYLPTLVPGTQASKTLGQSSITQFLSQVCSKYARGLLIPAGMCSFTFIVRMLVWQTKSKVQSSNPPSLWAMNNTQTEVISLAFLATGCVAGLLV